MEVVHAIESYLAWCFGVNVDVALSLLAAGVAIYLYEIIRRRIIKRKNK